MPLNEYDPTELVSITRQHIQETLAALNWTYVYFTSLDIADRAREGKPSGKASPVTIMIERAYNHIEGYIADVNLPSE